LLLFANENILGLAAMHHFMRLARQFHVRVRDAILSGFQRLSGMICMRSRRRWSAVWRGRNGGSR
jgi:hypothetical protein